MKTKRKATAQKTPAAKEVSKPAEEEEGINQGFSEWLKSGPGVEYMKVFVLLNTLIVFLTMAWPQIQIFFSTLMSFFEE